MFNDEQNKIIIKTKANKEFVDKYKDKFKIQHRKLLYYQRKKVKQKSEVFRFFFKRSRSLHRFLNQKFEVVYFSKIPQVPDHIRFIFTEMGKFFPRKVSAEILQGTLSINKGAPPKFVAHLTSLHNKKTDEEKPLTYAVAKTYSDSKNQDYNLLITFNEAYIKKIKKDSKTDINTYNGHNFYLKKKLYSEFLKPKGSIFLTIPNTEELILFRRLAREVNPEMFDKIWGAREEFDEEKIDRRKISKEFKERVNEKIKNEITKYKKNKTHKKLLTVFLHLSTKSFKFYLNSEIYHQYLLENKYFKSIEEINEVRKLSQKMKGISNYFIHIKSFLEYIKSINLRGKRKENEKIYFKEIKNNLQSLDLEEYSFDNVIKRTRYNTDVTAIFMDNYDVLITKDSSLLIDYSLQMINEDLDSVYEESYTNFIGKYQKKFDSKQLFNITNLEYDIIKDLLMQLKIDSQKNINSELIEKTFYFASILKTNINIIQNRFSRPFDVLDQKTKKTKTIQLSPFNKKTVQNLPLIIGVYNSFFDSYPEMTKEQFIKKFFIRNFGNLTTLNRESFEYINRYSEDLMYLYLVKQDLKFLVEYFDNVFTQQHTLETNFKKFLKDYSKSIPGFGEKIQLISDRINSRIDEASIDQIISLIKDYFANVISNKEKKMFNNFIKDIKHNLTIKVEGLKEVRTIMQLSGNMAKLSLKWAQTSHDRLAASAFAMFVLALNLESKIILGSISNNDMIQIDQTSMSRQIKKMTRISDDNYDFDFENRVLTSDDSKSIIRQAIIDLSIGALIADIQKNYERFKKESRLNTLFEILFIRLDYLYKKNVFTENLMTIIPHLYELRNQRFSIKYEKKLDKYFDVISPYQLIYQNVLDIVKSSVKKERQKLIKELSEILMFFVKYKSFDDVKEKYPKKLSILLEDLPHNEIEEIEQILLGNLSFEVIE